MWTLRQPLLLALISCTPTPAQLPDTTGSTPVVPSAEVVVGYSELMAHHAWLEVSLDAPGLLAARCEAPEVADEIVLGSLPEPVSQGNVDLFGLLADTAYDCALTVDGTEVAVASLLTGPAADVPEWEVEQAGTPWGVWTLFNLWTVQDSGNQTLVVVDPLGRMRWSSPIGSAMQGGIEFTWQPQHQRFLAGGGEGYNPRWIDLAGQVLAMAPETQDGQFHHDVEPVDDHIVGALVTHSEHTPGGAPYVGFGIEEHNLTTGELVWRWESQQAVDAGELDPGETGPTDRFHANALSLVQDDEGTAWYVSMAYKDRIARIDRQTGAVSWELGKHGDFALQDASGAPLELEDWFYMPHDPEIDLPRLLVHDNGNDRPGGGFSRMVEYNVDLATKTVTLVREYTQEGWFETVFGDADTLPNGHALLTQGHCYICIHGANAARSTILELDSDWQSEHWRLTTPGKTTGIYRAERFEGCDLFQHAGYCPDLR